MFTKFIWSSFNSVCNSNNYTVFFKLIQCCVNYVAIKLEGNNEIRCFFKQLAPSLKN